MFSKFKEFVKGLLSKTIDRIKRAYAYCWNTNKYTRLLVIPLTLFLLSTPIIFIALTLVYGIHVALAYLICRLSGVCPI